MNDSITFTGFIADIYTFLFQVTAFTVTGTFVVWNYLIMELLIRLVVMGVKSWRYFIAFIRFRKDFKSWFDGFEVQETEKYSALTRRQIIGELKHSLRDLGADSELLSIVGSVGDTLSDVDALEMLKDYNEYGTAMDEVIEQVK